jgi:FixJ family two-component response regulator
LNPVVYIVDDDQIFRTQIGEFLQARGYRVVLSPSAAHFLSVFEPEQRGCIIMDERMPGQTGSEALAAISRWLPIYPAILLTGYADVKLAVSVMKTGAFDLMEKPIENQLLLKKVEEALAWGAEVWSRHSADARVWSDLQTLTAREKEILGLIIEGQSSKTIGNHLNISARTVDNHRVHILSKMRAKSLSDLGRSVARATAIFAEHGINARIVKGPKGK